MLIVRKSLFLPGAEGFILTVSSGNHSVAALPLLRGDFWHLGRLPQRQRSEAMLRGVVCCNFVGETIEISQRDVPTSLVVAADEWLRGLGWPLDNVVLAERVDATLEYYRRMGQEWRIKPLAWTREEMELALRSSRARIHSCASYYHNVKGVHLLTFSEFGRLQAMASEDFARFRECLAELVGVPEGARESLARTPKFHGHHEIELFGLRGAQALDTLVPALERLHADIQSGACPAPEAVARLAPLFRLFRQSLENPELADEHSPAFVEGMYKHLTGEVYYGSADQVMPAFDDRKTALPGATFRGGKAEMHPGCDARTRAILEYIELFLSHGEALEYANVYELRTNNPVALGRGPAREIVFKTTRRALCQRLIEKRLAHLGAGYGNYMLTRVQAFQNLGVAYGDHHLLARHDGHAGEVHYFIRHRYPGYPFGAIARTRFQAIDDPHGNSEDPEVILLVAALIGNAAAQNLVVKKYIPEKHSIQFGEGKEIVEFAYDVRRMREMPLTVRLCSVRGTLGWPDHAWTDENLTRCFDTYMSAFARCLLGYWREHAAAVTLEQVRERFLDGFAAATRTLNWNYTGQREQFDLFDPEVRAVFNFKAKWRFALWALTQQQRRLPELRTLFALRLQELAAAEPPPA